jgi:hypothetical protein
MAAGSRRQLTRAALYQRFVVKVRVGIVTCGVFGRISGGYGKPAENYVPMELEHAAQEFIFKHWLRAQPRRNLAPLMIKA